MRPLLLVLILSASTFGCSKKEKESATTTEGATAKPTTGDQPKTDRAADDKATEDLQARRAEEAKAAEAKAAADAEAVKAHAATHEQLKEKADKLTGAKKKNADAAVAAVKTAEATMMANVAKLREASAAQWDAAKAQVEADAVALNKSIDALETAVK